MSKRLPKRLPDDVLQKATEIINEMHGYGTDHDTTEGRERDARLIASALLAERRATISRTVDIMQNFDEYAVKMGITK